MTPDADRSTKGRSGAGETRMFVVTTLALGVAALAVAVWSATRGGIGWDARYDTEAAFEIRATDTDQPLDEAYERVRGTSEFYGVVPQVGAETLHRMVGGSGQLGADDPKTYAYQSAFLLLLSALAVTALAITVGVVTRSAVGAAVTWSLCFSTPLWLGMSHVNAKDIPVAAGLTFVTAGLMISLAVRSGVWAAAIGALLIGIGALSAVGTRAGSVVLVGGLVVATVLAALWVGRVRRRPGSPPLAPVLVATVTGVASAVLALLAMNPLARIDLVNWLRDAASVAVAYPSELTIRTAGQELESWNLPFWYAPAWFGAQLPVLSILGLGAAAIVLLSLSLRRRAPIRPARAVALTPLVAQGVIFPVAIVLRDPVLYDGIRHLLFILPPLLALIGIATAVITRQQLSLNRLRAVRLFVLVVIGVSLLESARWAPYAYAHINPIAGWKKNRTAWELDYWGVSGREGMERLRQLGLSSTEVQPAADVGIPWASSEEEASERGVYHFRRGNGTLDERCEVLFVIVRAGHTLGEGARCPR